MTLNSRQNRPDTGWKFDNTYAQLPKAFYVRLNERVGTFVQKVR
jgi:hypothetical protein